MSDTPSDSEQGSVAPEGATVPHRALRTRFCDLVGCRLPIVQTGMGWVSGASLTAATSRRRGLRHPRRGDDDARPVRRRGPHREAAHRHAVRRQLPSRPARPRRPHRPVRPRGRAPGQLRRCSHQGRHRPAARRRHPRHADRRRPPPRREDARAGASTPSSPRAARAAATPARCPRRCCCPRWSTRWATPSRCSAPAASTTGAASSPRWPGAPTAWPWAPASSSPPRAACPTTSRPATWPPR